MGNKQAREAIKNCDKDQKILYLAGIGLKKLPKQLRSLTHLQALELSENAIESLPSWLVELTELRSFTLTGNPLRSLLANVSELSALRELDLSRTTLEDLGPLASLSKLESLGMSQCGLELFPEELLSMRGLLRLDLSLNRITKLPASINRKLNKLAHLNLQGNVCPHPVQSLPFLPEEIFDDHQFPTSEHGITLVHMKTVEMELPSLVGFEHLCGILSLQVLNLNFNNIRTIPSSISKLWKLKELHLRGNPVESVPSSICKLPLELLELDLEQVSDPQDRRAAQELLIELLPPLEEDDSRPSILSLLSPRSREQAQEQHASSSVSSTSSSSTTTPSTSASSSSSSSSSSFSTSSTPPGGTHISPSKEKKGKIFGRRKKSGDDHQQINVDSSTAPLKLSSPPKPIRQDSRGIAPTMVAATQEKGRELEEKAGTKTEEAEAMEPSDGQGECKASLSMASSQKLSPAPVEHASQSIDPPAEASVLESRSSLSRGRSTSVIRRASPSAIVRLAAAEERSNAQLHRIMSEAPTLRYQQLCGGQDELTLEQLRISIGLGTHDTTLLDCIFGALDVDNSGALSQKEFVVGLDLLVNGSFEDQVDFQFNLYDVDGDGILSKSDFMALSRSIFLSAQAARQKAANAWMQRISTSCGVGEGGYEMETMWSQLWAQSGSNSAEEKFDRIDVDHDDVLSLHEFTNYCKDDPKAISSVKEYAEYLLRGTLPYLGESKKQSTFQMMAMLYGINRK